MRKSNWIISPGRDENKTCLSCHHLDFFVFGKVFFLCVFFFVYVKFWRALKLVKFDHSDAYKTWINFGRLGEVPKGRNTHLSPSAWVLGNSSLQNDVVRMIVFPDPTYKAIGDNTVIVPAHDFLKWIGPCKLQPKEQLSLEEKHVPRFCSESNLKERWLNNHIFSRKMAMLRDLILISKSKSGACDNFKYFNLLLVMLPPSEIGEENATWNQDNTWKVPSHTVKTLTKMNTNTSKLSILFGVYRQTYNSRDFAAYDMRVTDPT